MESKKVDENAGEDVHSSGNSLHQGLYKGLVSR
jgi:hypothetical protein